MAPLFGILTSDLRPDNVQPAVHAFERGCESVIRFRTLHASTASRRCPDERRARRQSPTIDVYRKNAFSTRAC